METIFMSLARDPPAGGHILNVSGGKMTLKPNVETPDLFVIASGHYRPPPAALIVGKIDGCNPDGGMLSP
jgi:hypothetical protein